MRDPHVVALHYRVVTDRASFEFKDAPPVEHEEAAFSLRLEDDKLRVDMKGHHATPESAREVVDPFLDSWEIAAALHRGRREMRLQFERVEMVDRTPGAGQVVATGEVSCTASVYVVAKVEAHEYPRPPAGFVASPDVQALMYRYDRYVTDRELLLGMANFCLTFLEQRGMAIAQAQGGGTLTKRQAAARFYAVAEDVLGKIGRLCATRGDTATARKFDPQGVPLTGPEVAWIEAAARRVIRRVGEHDFDPAATLPTITMADLPTLP
jgi:hypothetical protein